MTKIAVIGSGMAGCGATYRLRSEGLESVMYDQNGVPGGHTKTYTYEGGWIFDDGPHVSFTKNKRLQELFASNIGYDYHVVDATVNNYWQGFWIKHPAQVNLHGLPEALVVDCLNDFIAAQHAGPGTIDTYEDWLLASFGRTFAETFPMQYTRKVHTTTADNMATEWIGPRLYRPQLKEVLLGALTDVTPDVHYIDDFRYPTHGGFFAYIKPFLANANLHLGHRLTSVDPTSRLLTFESGVQVSYSHLISSVPLPDLIPMIVGVPGDVVAAAAKLAATSCVMVNVGIDRDDITESTWTYFYDEDFVITRLSFPHRFSPETVPSGCGSFQCEIYFSDKYKPLIEPPSAYIDRAINDLRRCGLIRPEDRILFKHATLSRYANVIYDLDRAAALEVVHGFLDDLEIRYCGRYGEWGYQWTDEAFISGENAAQKVIDGL